MAKGLSASVEFTVSAGGDVGFAGGIVGVDEVFTLAGEPKTSPATVTGFKGNGQR
jgi:hypothetical protein